MRSILKACQASFGDPPRSLTPEEERRFRIWPPLWCLLGDPLLRMYWSQNKLRDRGRVVWGHLVQANNLLFRPGGMNCPANVVYNPTSHDDRDVDALAEVAHNIFELKGKRHREKDLKRCARWVTQEKLRVFDAAVPTSLTSGREIIFSTLMVHRKHLPDGYLSTSVFPLIINPEETSSVMILPCDYWPDELSEP
jgi:hypothetical protein